MQAKSNFQFTKIRIDAFSEEFIQWIIPNQSSKSGFKSTVNGTVAFPVEFTKGVKLTIKKPGLQCTMKIAFKWTSTNGSYQ